MPGLSRSQHVNSQFPRFQLIGSLWEFSLSWLAVKGTQGLAISDDTQLKCALKTTVKNRSLMYHNFHINFIKPLPTWSPNFKGIIQLRKTNYVLGEAVVQSVIIKAARYFVYPNWFYAIYHNIAILCNPHLWGRVTGECTGQSDGIWAPQLTIYGFFDQVWIVWSWFNWKICTSDKFNNY